MSLYADQHAKKLCTAQPPDTDAAATFRRTSEKENVRFRRSSRPALPIGSASKRSSAASATGDSPAPRAPLNAPIASDVVHVPSLGTLARTHQSHMGEAARKMAVSPSHTPSTLGGLPSTQASPASTTAEAGPAVEQEAVAQLLTRASEALKAERAHASALLAEKDTLWQALQRLCDCYMSLEAVVTATEPSREGSPCTASTALLGLQVRALAEQHQLRLPAPQRTTLDVLTPREASAPVAAAAHGVPATAVSSTSTPVPQPLSPRPSSQRASSARRARHGASLAVTETNGAALPRTRSASATVAGRAATGDAYEGTVAVVSAAHGAAAQEAMASRLRRALAPQPTREQVGDVVDAMIEAIQHDPSRLIPAAGVPGGPRFRLTRVSACTYRLQVGTAAALHAHTTAKATTSARATTAVDARRADRLRAGTAGGGVHESLVHLVISSGSLRVVRGGGPVDFFDFMDRKLRLMQRPV